MTRDEFIEGRLAYYVTPSYSILGPYKLDAIERSWGGNAIVTLLEDTQPHYCRMDRVFFSRAAAVNYADNAKKIHSDAADYVRSYYNTYASEILSGYDEYILESLHNATISWER